ncbi:hypothetical protein [uncultured Shewanella sp.]|uniref:hypothetical protein n=1 Tax=uncultured Shewanella sp. TaxID=173975 RepID=UPI00260D8BF0|nr:hypothetical protein [uncultured Shewanella sp.]
MAGTPENNQKALINNATLTVGVNQDKNKKVKDDKENAEFTALKKQFSDLSRKFDAFACCQQPFDQALSHYLATSFEDFELKKRP